MENARASTSAPHVLITGAARGIGKAMVNDLAAAGWHVIAGVRNERDADAITESYPRRISAVILDVTNAEHIANLPNRIPRLDAVVNNAGIVVGGPVEALAPEQWRCEEPAHLDTRSGVTPHIASAIVGEGSVSRIALRRQ
ncbi:hypothetical protein DQP55_18335 [Mycolicibacterium sp. GF69]|uniref:SDR family oxidoreductase n=1 Tax=Mycolicibacterium sp. GF69 TaxID=2267251 RepID=UPI000DCDCDA6|nr:SDR family NAD(P)-dependent oxidoreductase [Mycolicibacterium sp. GF69]RAV08930.1 hypothetical protein DQP55_18335 [Mycolicibacterium sp. GF69]